MSEPLSKVQPTFEAAIDDVPLHPTPPPSEAGDTPAVKPIGNVALSGETNVEPDLFTATPTLQNDGDVNMTDDASFDPDSNPSADEEVDLFEESHEDMKFMPGIDDSPENSGHADYDTDESDRSESSNESGEDDDSEGDGQDSDDSDSSTEYSHDDEEEEEEEAEKTKVWHDNELDELNDGFEDDGNRQSGRGIQVGVVNPSYTDPDDESDENYIDAEVGSESAASTESEDEDQKIGSKKVSKRPRNHNMSKGKQRRNGTINRPVIKPINKLLPVNRKTHGPSTTGFGHLMATYETAMSSTALSKMIANSHLDTDVYVPDVQKTDKKARRDTVIREFVRQAVLGLDDQKEIDKALEQAESLIVGTQFLDRGKGTALVYIHGAKDQRRPWTLLGLKTPLYWHQLEGVILMLVNENREVGIKGGIMADSPGLGKTLQILGAIVRSYRFIGKEARCTLIVVPKSLLKQWEAEIEKHVEEKWAERTILWRDVRDDVKNKRFKSQDIAQQMIFLVTYTQLIRNKETFEQLQFRRIVLDEGHEIKTHETKRNTMTSSIDADCRWIVSGTPLTNNISEMFSYMKFFGDHRWRSSKAFQKDLDETTESGLSSITLLLQEIMIRRTADMMSFGVPILNLPKAYETKIMIELDKVTAFLYRLVSERVGMLFKQAKGKVTQRTIDALTDVLTDDKAEGGLTDNDNASQTSTERETESPGFSVRQLQAARMKLCQLVNHFVVAEEAIKTLVKEDDMEELHAICDTYQNQKLTKANFKNLRYQLKILQDKTVAAAEAKSEGPSFVRDDSQVLRYELENPDHLPKEASGLAIGKPHGVNITSFDFEHFWNDLEGKTLTETELDINCVFCGSVPKDEHALACDFKHSTCYGCWESKQDENPQYVPCPRCNNNVAAAPQPKSDSSDLKKFKKVKDEVPSNWLAHLVSWPSVTGIPPAVATAKTLAFKAQVMNWMEEDPLVRIVVFTEFRTTLKIYQSICDAEKWRVVLYHGGLDEDERQFAIDKFGSPDIPNPFKKGKMMPPFNLMLCTTKAGGVGLNLMMATKVIIMDPWWNESVDLQAFCRVYRIGQTKPCHLVRFFAADSNGETIEDHMSEVQVNKRNKLDPAMFDGAVRDHDNDRQIIEYMTDVNKYTNTYKPKSKTDNAKAKKKNGGKTKKEGSSNSKKRRGSKVSRESKKVKLSDEVISI